MRGRPYLPFPYYSLQTRPHEQAHLKINLDKRNSCSTPVPCRTQDESGALAILFVIFTLESPFNRNKKPFTCVTTSHAYVIFGQKKKCCTIEAVQRSIGSSWQCIPSLSCPDRPVFCEALQLPWRPRPFPSCQPEVILPPPQQSLTEPPPPRPFLLSL